MVRRGRAVAGALLAGAALVGSVGVFVPSASATPADGYPFGFVDQVSPTSTGLHVSGWVIDPDGAPVANVHVYVDGAPVAAVRADRSRPDVAAYFPYGPGHGFDADIATAHGTHAVCVYGINSGGAGDNILLGCQTVHVGHSPFGFFDVGLPRPGGGTLVGWALDPDTTAPIAVHVYVDGTLAGAFLANGQRPDVGAAFGNGSAHGFNVAVDIPVGNHQVCIYAIDANGDPNAVIECGAANLDGTPFGFPDVLEASGSSIRVAGWAIDPDTVATVSVHVYINEQLTVLTANRPRPDVGAAYPAYGPNHGYDGLAAVPPSARGGGNFCVFLPNVAGQGSTGGGCMSFPAR
jgi:hypothetical protein